MSEELEAGYPVTLLGRALLGFPSRGLGRAFTRSIRIS